MTHPSSKTIRMATALGTSHLGRLRNPLRAHYLSIAALAVLTMSCAKGTEESDKPSGTPTDPVTKCERHGQVCKMDSSRLGVCIEPREEVREKVCQGTFPCLQCVSQH